MNATLHDALLNCETNIDEALGRLSGDEELYMYCLEEFLCDPTMDELDAALEGEMWDEAFTAAHALKGLAGNMGFIPLFHAAAELVVLIRTGRTEEIGWSYKSLKRCYGEIVKAIRTNSGTDAAE